jgi:hypothetical protein
MQTCLDQYNANKVTNGNGGLKWIQKGGGYYTAEGLSLTRSKRARRRRHPRESFGTVAKQFDVKRPCRALLGELLRLLAVAIFA